MFDVIQAAEPETRQAATCPWALSLGRGPADVPASWTTSRRWTARDRTLQMFTRGLGQPPGTAEYAGWVIQFDGDLHEPAALAARLDAPAGSPPAALVARAVACWGRDAFLHIKGVFAVAAWHAADDLLLLARDPVGMFPLFFSEAGGRIACSTDPGLLLALPWVSSEVNRAALADHLSHRWLSPEETHYTDLARVPAGSAVAWRAGHRTIDRYWFPVDPSGEVDWVREDELDEFHVRFDEAVGRALAFGKTGIFLSGGFDSVSIAAAATDLAARTHGPRPIAASLAFPDPSCNEEPVQRTVADSLGMEQFFLRLDDAVAPAGLIQSGIDINRSSVMPMMNAWRPAYRALGDAARVRGCEAIVTGEGGDEWLTVGSEYIVDLMRGLQVTTIASVLATVLRSYDTSRTLLVYNMLWRSGLRLLLASWGRTLLRQVAPARLSRHRLSKLQSRSPEWVSPEPALQAQLQARMEAWVEISLREPEPDGPFGFYLSTFPGSFVHPLRSLDLEEIHGSRSRNGLRELQPFWDPDLIQYLARIPPRILDRGGRTKGLVRDQVAARFPDLGFERHRKISASTFFSETVAAEAPPAWERLGGVRTLAALGIVDAGKAEAAAKADVGQIARSGNCRVWEMLNLEAWARAHA